MQQGFVHAWGQAAHTSLGFFWMALWAFVLGYVISSMIQVFVTRERMQRAMGDAGAKSVGLGTFFGFISSSCSFAALATTKALYKKGAGFIPAMAFLLASTNLVVELGIVIAVFLTWQFVVGEYVGGLLLIGFMWLFVRLTYPHDLIEDTRERVREQEGTEEEDGEVPDWRRLIRSRDGWERVARRYVMEWGMVWKDVTVGFTVAGLIAVFVPTTFFEALFVGAGQEGGIGFFALLEQVLVGPVAAFFTFIGSMGNIPLAAVLYGNGVSFAGVMAFIFSDLVVFPVLRINAAYYGWKMALYIMLTLLVSLVAASLLMHGGLALAGLLPETGATNMAEQTFFKFNYTFVLNMVFLAVSGGMGWLYLSRRSEGGHGSDGQSIIERVLFWLALASYLWLAGGLVAFAVTGGTA